MLAETEDIQAVIRAVTDYVALRVVERSKALAADSPAPAMKPAFAPARTRAAPCKGRSRNRRRPTLRPTPPAPLVFQPPRGRPHYGLPPIVVFMLGVVAGIMATLFVGILRARGLLLSDVAALYSSPRFARLRIRWLAPNVQGAASLVRTIRFIKDPSSGEDTVTTSPTLCVKPLPGASRSSTGANMVPR